MNPTIGRIVIIHDPNGTWKEFPAIVTQVHSEDCINCSAFIPNGNVSGYSSLQRKGVAPETAPCWDWPART